MLMVGNCPVHWVSKLQTEISTEYIALSMAMHDLILLWTLMDEVKELLGAKSLPSCTYSKIFQDNNGDLILVTSPQMTLSSKHITIK